MGSNSSYSAGYYNLTFIGTTQAGIQAISWGIMLILILLSLLLHLKCILIAVMDGAYKNPQVT